MKNTRWTKGFRLFSGGEEAEKLLLKQAETGYQIREGVLWAGGDPWEGQTAQKAPLLCALVSTEGRVRCLFSRGVPPDLAQRLNKLAQALLPKDPMGEAFFTAAAELLPHAVGTGEYSFLVPVLPLVQETVSISTQTQVKKLTQKGFDWLSVELPFLEHCEALVQEGQIVSLCRSVRSSPEAEEAGIETLPDFRGQNLAAAALASWAAQVQSAGKLAFYSTSFQNHSSQRLAQKAGLLLLGVHLTLYPREV